MRQLPFQKSWKLEIGGFCSEERKKMLEAADKYTQLQSCFGDCSSSEEELTVLPRHTKVVVTGNNRTKSVLVGLQGVVKKAVGLGGWHWLVRKQNQSPSFFSCSNCVFVLLVQSFCSISLIEKSWFELKSKNQASSFKLNNAKLNQMVVWWCCWFKNGSSAKIPNRWDWL